MLKVQISIVRSKLKYRASVYKLRLCTVRLEWYTIGDISQLYSLK